MDEHDRAYHAEENKVEERNCANVLSKKHTCEAASAGQAATGSPSALGLISKNRATQTTGDDKSAGVGEGPRDSSDGDGDGETDACA